MAREIERKFLLVNDHWRRHVVRRDHFVQGYLCTGAGLRSSVRVRIGGTQAWVNIKSLSVGIERLEFEYEIPVTDAEEMIAQLCEGPLIEKTRYFVECAGHHWEVDIFEGDNAGLEVAEIELTSPHEVVTFPEWIGTEVTNDLRYYNACLVKKPFKSW
ncbi:MAG: CYTH domain-containing protein [Thiotrichales bacterium]